MSTVYMYMDVFNILCAFHITIFHYKYMHIKLGYNTSNIQWQSQKYLHNEGFYKVNRNSLLFFVVVNLDICLSHCGTFDKDSVTFDSKLS